MRQMRTLRPIATSMELGLLAGLLAGIAATLLDVRAHSFEIDAPWPVGAAFPEQEDTDHVLLDQRGKLFRRPYDREAPQPAALLTDLDVTIENAALVEPAWLDRC